MVSFTLLFFIKFFNFKFGSSLFPIVDCGHLHDPANGVISITTIGVGGIATYSCNERHILVGVDTRMCQEDGIWSDKAPTCESK